jgi:ATP-binding cassette subfamily B protein
VDGPARAPAVPMRTVFARFWPYTKGHRAMLALGTILILIGVPLETVAIWLFRLLVDEVLQPADFGAFPRIAADYVGLTIVMGVVSFAAGQTMTRVSQSFLLSLRTHVFRYLHTLSMDFFEQRRLGDLLSRVNGDVSAIESLVLSGVSTAISSGLRVIVYGAMLFVVNPPLAATAIIVTPLLWLIGRLFSRRLKAVSRESRHRYGALSSVAEESLSTVSLVQAYNRQADEVRRYEVEGRAVLRAGLTSSRLRGLYSPFVGLVELAGLLLVIGYGTWQLSHHVMTLGGLLVFMAYFAQMYGPLKGLGSLSNSLYSASAGAERILEVLDAEPSVAERPNALPLQRVDGVVEFRDVSFSYPGRDKLVLDRVSFTARPGQLVAVVGRSGSGKTTLGKLLLRFYDPTSGSVCVDGNDLTDVRLNDVREQIAVVMQETLVMDGTIRENILWGRSDATGEQLDRAVREADVDTVIADLPDGLETRVGYRGRRLSGGQRQRVAIARAMIRDAPVLLLDEPGTGLDAAAEQRVMEPLHRLMGGRTTILISHNLLAVKDAALILVLDQGRVVEAGTHQELYARGGHYFRLYMAQHAFDPDAAPQVPAYPQMPVYPAQPYPVQPYPVQPYPAQPHPRGPLPPAAPAARRPSLFPSTRIPVPGANPLG